VVPCRSCVNRRFRRTYRLHLQGRKIRERGTSMSGCQQTEPPVENTQLYIRTGHEGRHWADTSLKEHQQHVHLEHPDKSAMAEHSVNLGHHIQFHNTSILASKTRYMDRIVRGAIEIELRPNSMNRVVGFCLSKSWKPLICPLKKSPEHDPKSTRLCRSVHAQQPEATGSMLAR
jgi:hypothetical protein